MTLHLTDDPNWEQKAIARLYAGSCDHYAIGYPTDIRCRDCGARWRLDCSGVHWLDKEEGHGAVHGSGNRDT